MFSFPYIPEKDNAPILLISTIFSSVVFFLAAITTAITGYKYYLNSHHFVFKKRYAFITLLSIAASITKLVCTAIRTALGLRFPSTHPLIIFFGFCSNFCLVLVQCFFLWRFSLLCWDINFLYLSVNHRWQSLITNTSTANKSAGLMSVAQKLDWYEAHKHQYHNHAWLWTRVLLPMSVIGVIGGLPSLPALPTHSHTSNMNMNVMVNWLLTGFAYAYSVLIISALTLIYRRIPRLNDNLYICAELRRILYLLCGWLVIFLAETVLQPSSGTVTAGNTNKAQRLPLLMAVLVFASQACAFAQMMVVSWWVNKKVQSLLVFQQHPHPHPHTSSQARWRAEHARTAHGRGGGLFPPPLNSSAVNRNDRHPNNTAVQPMLDSSSAVLDVDVGDGVGIINNSDSHSDLNIEHSRELCEFVSTMVQTTESLPDRMPTIVFAQTLTRLVFHFARQPMFEQYAAHVMRDFSIQTLVAFVEFGQYQQYTSALIKEKKRLRLQTIKKIQKRQSRRQQHDDEQNGEEAEDEDTEEQKQPPKRWYRYRERETPLLFDHIRFYPGFPKSDIVYAADEELEEKIDVDAVDEHGSMGPAVEMECAVMHGVKLRAHQLFMKYVEYGSSFEVDIAGSTRVALVEVLEHRDRWLYEHEMDLQSLLHLFDDCCEELLNALVYSFYRYQETKQYRKARNLMKV